MLMSEGVFANLIVVTSPDLLIDNDTHDTLWRIVPEVERSLCVPVLTVTDSHPSFLAGIANSLATGGRQPIERALGITHFDRSGTEHEIGGYHGIHAPSIVDAARGLKQL
jgi:pyruvate dehydrogenase complex dehydrogenase (E1) component